MTFSVWTLELCDCRVYLQDSLIYSFLVVSKFVKEKIVKRHESPDCLHHCRGVIKHLGGWQIIFRLHFLFDSLNRLLPCCYCRSCVARKSDIAAEDAAIFCKLAVTIITQ